MNKAVYKLIGTAFAASLLVGCASASSEDYGTVLGASAGSLIGFGINSASPLSSVVGAGIGALVGREVGRRADY
jgi:hypothetical protein